MEAPAKPKKKGSKQLLLELFLANIGKVLTSRQLQEASGWAAEWARRIRELRDEQGYLILSHNDRADLKPGEYLLETDQRKEAFARGISKEVRAFVLDRDGSTCQSCGLAAGDQDPFNTERKVRLTMGHIIDKSKGGTDDPNNLKAICANCNEGLQNTALPKPERVHLLSMIRRAPVNDQQAVLAWLEEKFRNIKKEG
jgi:hypothetical protein